MSWNEHNVKRLRKLWGANCTANEIARDLGVSKNAVLGKAHRLGLAERPSPIGVKKEKPAPLPEDIRPPRRRQGQRAGRGEAPRPSAPAQRAAGAGRRCQFINGEVPRYPQEPDWCGAPAIEGKPYCAKHARRCYNAASKGEAA